MSPLPDLAGRLWLRPGPASGAVAIESTRPVGLQRVAIGRGADELPALMASLHALCAHAHRLAARLAVRAALGEDGAPTADERLALQAGTARDQVLRLAHDWPRLLPREVSRETGDSTDAAATDAAIAAALRSCPLWRPERDAQAQIAALPAWLAQHWLGQPVDDWLRAWRDDPLRWPARWAQQGHTPLARLLDGQRAACEQLATPQRIWRPLDQPRHTASALLGALAVAGRDTLADAVLDTGPWSRARDDLRPPAHNAWMRLVSRLVDLLQLAGRDGRDWLSAGAARDAAYQGVAWVETARGLLVHRVVLDPTLSGGSAPRVRQFQLLAPTDLNFHPRGVLAEALQALPANDVAGATRLTVAFDPCVVFEVIAGDVAAPAASAAPATSAPGVSHA